MAAHPRSTGLWISSRGRAVSHLPDEHEVSYFAFLKKKKEVVFGMTSRILNSDPPEHLGDKGWGKKTLWGGGDNLFLALKSQQFWRKVTFCVLNKGEGEGVTSQRTQLANPRNIYSGNILVISKIVIFQVEESFLGGRKVCL